jgi:predicted metalloprotease
MLERNDDRQRVADEVLGREVLEDLGLGLHECGLGVGSAGSSSSASSSLRGGGELGAVIVVAAGGEVAVGLGRPFALAHLQQDQSSKSMKTPTKKNKKETTSTKKENKNKKTTKKETASREEVTQIKY